MQDITVLKVAINVLRTMSFIWFCNKDENASDSSGEKSTAEMFVIEIYSKTK